MLPVGENNPELLVDEFVPTAEQELLDQKTRMFIAEAKESLPLIDLRPFNPIEAGKRSYEASKQELGADKDDEAKTESRDNRGLSNGEVWIRIDPGQSSEYKEIMAQTADLYRTNTGYSGEVTVLLWVGGQVWERETYRSPW
jgi:hypothetical protein